MIIIDVLIGVVAGLLCLVPGFGISSAALIGLIFSQNAAIFAICTGLMASSYIESRSGLATGNVYVASMQTEVCVNEKVLFKKLVDWKLIYWLIGIAVGFLVPSSIGGSVFISCVVIVVIALRLTPENWQLCLMWLVMTQGLLLVLNWLGVTYPIGVLGMVCFIIPNLLLEQKHDRAYIETYDTNKILSPNAVDSLIGSLVAIFTPGISAQVITISFSKSSTVNKYMTTAVIEPLIEAIALVGLFKSNLLGKALIGTFGQVISFQEILLCCLLVALTREILLRTNLIKLIKLDKFNSNELRFIASVVGVVAVISACGFIASVIAISLGASISWVSNKMGVPLEARGMTFIASLI